MKPTDLLKILKKSRHWIVMLCLSNVFFIFLAWVAYPKTFKFLIYIMLTFSFFIIVVGMFIEWKKNTKNQNTFYHFLREPSEENERELINTFGKIHMEKIRYLGKNLRNLQDELSESKLQTSNYKEFIESWIHEVKAPITLMTLILENRKEEMSELVYQRIDRARIQISDNVEQILFFARLQGHHSDYKLERVSISDCCEEVLFELQSLIHEKEIKVISQFEEIPIVSDKKSLLFIITQILVNAIKYSKEDEGRMIWIKTGFEKDKYYLKVEDNGVGVLKSDLPFIFDKGFTGEHLTKKQSTGIGLYLVKKLCDDLKIEIEVESEFGKGFKIQFIFPKVE